MNRITYLSELYEKSVTELTKTRDDWKGLLSGMARYYKYSFDNNVLIYTQRPDASLLATMDVWNDIKVGRRINHAAKSIAVIDLSNPKASLKYLFDLMDTNGSHESLRHVMSFMWELEEQYRPGIMTKFHDKYGTDTTGIESCIYDLVEKRVNEILPQYLQGFSVTDPGSMLYGLPKEAVKEQFSELVRDSVGYMVFKKCGISTDMFEEDSFENISHFNSMGLFMRMGSITMSIARPILREINLEIENINTRGAGKMNTKPLIDLTYKEGADGMLYPNLQVSENIQDDLTETGKFGKLWKEYMRSRHPHRLSELIAEGKLNRMITEVDEEAENRKETLIQELLKAQPLPETEDTLERAAHMQMVTVTAEEIIMNEVALKVR